MSDDSKHTRRTLEIKRRRLWKLEKQAARHGPDCPPEIEMEIEDLREEIRRLEAAEGVAILPLPPQPCFAHYYPLQENFTGRVGERQMLTKWLIAGSRSVLALVALGGMGKSSLAWVWTRRDVAGLPVPGLPEDPPQVQSKVQVPEEHKPGGLLCYSFYEGGGTFRGFLETAIAYCSGRERIAQDYLTVPGPEGPLMDYATMQAELLQLLQQHRFLLIWDGAERLLREYGGLDASLREERDPEDMGPECRDTIEPAVGRFLRELAGQSSSRMLLTSRLYPRVLEGLAGARKQELKGLSEEHAIAYLRARGIRGHRAELVSAAREYGFHPLSLSNLAADLLEDFEQEGDISAAPRYDETETLKARRRHILERAYARRAPHRQELLSRLAAMRGTTPKEVVRLLAEDIAGVRPETLGRDLNELVRHGLLRHPAADRYDFHPVVRRYCYKRLEEKQEVHRRLMEHFSAIPEPGKVVPFEDLAPVIELYHHTAHAGRCDKAVKLFRDRLNKPLYYRFGAYQVCIELLRALFPEGEDKLPPLDTDDKKAWTLNELANSYGLSGQPRRAVPLYEMHNALQEKLSNKKNLAVGLGNVAGMAQIILGELAAAERNLRRSIELSREIENEFVEAIGHQELGRLLAYLGAFEEADRELDESTHYWEQTGDKQGICLDESYRALRALLMGQAQAALEAARRAHEIATSRQNENDRIRAEWLLGAALVALASEGGRRQDKLLAEAEAHLSEALTRCRRINLVELEPDILLSWARWHRARGEAEEARRDAAEALSIAERCEFRLKQAEIHNFLAQLAREAGQVDEARRQAEIARERARCDGPPHCYKAALEEAERLLADTDSGHG